MEIILLTIWWTVWKERNRRVFEGVDMDKGFDILKNRWVKTLEFLLLGHPKEVMESFLLGS